MNRKTTRTALAYAWAATAIIVALPFGKVLAHDQGNSGNRPLFQAPFPCGQVWEAKTYATHSPDADSIDLSEFGSDGQNTSQGRAVVASASGTVIKSLNSGGPGGWGVVIDHGGGWVTANSYHMEEDSPWPIKVGQKVVQGQHLGRTGSTGDTTLVHQHYTQLDHYHLGTTIKNAVRARFNGAPIMTHAANPAAWESGEEILSQNCAGNTFMGWNQNGQRYHLIYKPSDGSTKIVRMNGNGSVTTTYEKTWAKGWTHFMPFYGASGHPHAMVYKQTTGKMKFLRLGLGGQSVTTLATRNWAAGWTHFVPFSKANGQYFLAYDSVHGHANIDQISVTSDSSNVVYSNTWAKGHTAIVPYTEGPNRYLFLYKGGNGKAKVVKINGSGNGISTNSVWSDNWSGGYTTLTPLYHNGSRYLLGYKAETGFAKLMKINLHGQGVSTVKSMSWSKSWTAFSPFGPGGRLLIYKIGSGEVKTMRLKPNADGFDLVWSGSWAPGWT